MKIIAIAGLLVLLLTLGCVANSQTSTNTSHEMMDHPDDNMMKSGDAMPAKEEGAMMAGLSYVPFTQVAYDQAKADGKTIFLEFYANWCPICKAQAPALGEGFAQVHSDKLVAFRVNYKDSDTDADETALAQKYNITYQHTHVVVDSGEQVLLKSQEEWSAQDVVDHLSGYA